MGTIPDPAKRKLAAAGEKSTCLLTPLPRIALPWPELRACSAWIETNSGELDRRTKSRKIVNATHVESVAGGVMLTLVPIMLVESEDDSETARGGAEA